MEPFNQDQDQDQDQDEGQDEGQVKEQVQIGSITQEVTLKEDRSPSKA